jgi:ribosome maturation factor RimP
VAATPFTELLSRTLPALGYELVDVEWSPRARLLRVFIDKPQGVDVEDCANVSNHLTRLFAVENLDFERLEVSSPGLDRPLTRLADYTRFAGEEAELRFRAPIDGRRKLKGFLRGVDGDAVLVETDNGTQSVPFAEIGRARLVPKIDWRKGS